MASDLARAQAFIGGDPGFALRSASLPVLHAALARGRPWTGARIRACRAARLLARWRGQHRQLTAAGRYLREGQLGGRGRTAGLRPVARAAGALKRLDFRQAVLPAGSRVTVVTWAEAMDGAESFVAAQREAGLEATHVVLQASDMPDWDDASRFEAQVFPRRSVAEVAALIQEMPA